MAIPPELVWIQHLIDTYGVTGTLRLISASCADRAGLPSKQSVNWDQLAHIVAEAARQTGLIEPERITNEDTP